MNSRFFFIGMTIFLKKILKVLLIKMKLLQQYISGINPT